jgi:hypothetical protein
MIALATRSSASRRHESQETTSFRIRHSIRPSMRIASACDQRRRRPEKCTARANRASWLQLFNWRNRSVRTRKQYWIGKAGPNPQRPVGAGPARSEVAPQGGTGQAVLLPMRQQRSLVADHERVCVVEAQPPPGSPTSPFSGTFEGRIAPTASISANFNTTVFLPKSHGKAVPPVTSLVLPIIGEQS